MKKAVLALLLLPAVLAGQTQTQITIRKTFDYEQITVAGTAVGFDASKINPTCAGCGGSARATLAQCTVSTAAIRVRTDGTDPTASVGIPVAAGLAFSVFGYDDISRFKAIRVTDSAALDCQYSRTP